MAIYYLEREGLTHNMPMHGHFYTPQPTPRSRVCPAGTHDTWVKPIPGPTTQWRLRGSRCVRVAVMGGSALIARHVLHRALPLYGLAHRTTVIMWSCLLLLSLFLLFFSFSLPFLLINFVLSCIYVFFLLDFEEYLSNFNCWKIE